MKKILFAAAAVSLLSLPALAQSTPSGTSAGGPARVGTPGQVGGGVPGSQPNMGPGMSAPKKMVRHGMRKKHVRRSHKKMM